MCFVVFVFLRITPNNKVQESSYLARSRPHALENLPGFQIFQQRLSPCAAATDYSFNAAAGGAGRPRHSLGPSLSYGENPWLLL